jgi:hypothetical protein
MLPNSCATVTGLPPDNAIRKDVLFDMPPAISNEKDVAAAAEHDSDTDTTLIEIAIGRGADSVLESTVGDQATARDVVTDTSLHQRQQESNSNGRKQQQETTESMEQQADSTPLRWTTHSGTQFSPPRLGDDISLEAILKNVEENADSFASGLVHTRGDYEDVDNGEDFVQRTPIELRNRYVGAPGDRKAKPAPLSCF